MTPGEHAPDPREARNPAEFLARLQALKDWSGLTYRELSARAETRGDVLPRSTVANMLARPTLPREELLTAFVRACGVEDGEAEAWRTVRRELATRRAYGADRAGAVPGAGMEAAPGAEAEATDDGAQAGAMGPGPAEAPAGPEGAEGPDAAGGLGGSGDLGGPGGPGDGSAAGSPGGPGSPAGTASRIRRALVATVAFAGLVLAGGSVVAFLRDGHAGHPPRTPTAPAAGDVRIRVAGTDFCLGERRGTRSGQVHQLPCAAAGLPRYSLAEAGGGRWRIVSDHPDFGPGCSGIPSGGRIPDAAYEDSECGDPTRVESFALEAYGTPVEGYRIVPVDSATPGSCVTVVGDRSAAWARLAQAPCAPDAAGQLFDFDRWD
ncbi:helix-turn-helix transcriptional regulator [Streptomyces sp. NK15101]|uniref:helix-turn-helix domain-containing protein n=1 Tax=Streptomyces sp. NK15101 TaxID=2873261 RepID=UPI001CED1336|nr:helix-turn-helix transcriptional regulator [Streptomyces sp. NK15101]